MQDLNAQVLAHVQALALLALAAAEQERTEQMGREAISRILGPERIRAFPSAYHAAAQEIHDLSAEAVEKNAALGDARKESEDLKQRLDHTAQQLQTAISRVYAQASHQSIERDFALKLLRKHVCVAPDNIPLMDILKLMDQRFQTLRNLIGADKPAD
jgi:hypothetical protein